MMIDFVCLKQIVVFVLLNFKLNLTKIATLDQYNNVTLYKPTMGQS